VTCRRRTQSSRQRHLAVEFDRGAHRLQLRARTPADQSEKCVDVTVTVFAAVSRAGRPALHRPPRPGRRSRARRPTSLGVARRIPERQPYRLARTLPGRREPVGRAGRRPRCSYRLPRWPCRRPAPRGTERRAAVADATGATLGSDRLREPRSGGRADGRRLGRRWHPRPGRRPTSRSRHQASGRAARERTRHVGDSRGGAARR